jgi:arsenate reductase (glutaredoxin)
MVKLYGIPNCDTVKKAQTFLDKKKVDYEFVNFKKTPPTKEELMRWKKAMGEWPINKKGLTFKKYKDDFLKLKESEVPAFLIEHSSMIKRPILEENSKVLLFGFDELSYKGLSLF